MKEAHAIFAKEYKRTSDPVKSALKAGSLERLAASDAQRWLERGDVQAQLAAPDVEKAPRKRQPATTRKRVTRKK